VVAISVAVAAAATEAVIVNQGGKSAARNSAMRAPRAANLCGWEKPTTEIPTTNVKQKELMNFSQLGLDEAQLRVCESLGYKEPTPIQRQAIPLVLKGQDVIGCAETGTGKTAAFLFPILKRIAERRLPGIRALVVVPTRELALQIHSNYEELNHAKENRSAILIGGANINTQLSSLRRRPAVVIATPGRLLDLADRGALNLATVEFLVLDEADRMLDMGFLPDIRRVFSLVPAKRQTLLFSATLPPEIERLARSTMKEPKFIEVSPRGTAARLIEQTAYQVAAESKTALLLDLLEREKFDRVLVFARTKRAAERLSHILSARNHRVNRIHSDRSQPQREAALSGFRDGRTRVLVATDIAARGLDVDSVSHVINYDVPAAPEDYVHRIGRTGRAGSKGQAITIVTPVDELSLRAIERLMGETVKRIVPSGFGGTLPAAPSSKPFAPRSRSAVFTRSFRPRRASR
jgi:ATP-dependent RNA helicase RhlE